jgi:hypothetical protein
MFLGGLLLNNRLASALGGDESDACLQGICDTGFAEEIAKLCRYRR